MKRFIISVLCVAVFFIGLGGLVEKATANFKSDERALEIIKKARIAIGGEANIANVRSLTITGKTTKTLEFDGAPRNEQGDLEINLELPNRFGKMLKFGKPDGGETEVFEKKIDVLVVRKGDKDVLMKSDGANGEKKTMIFKKGDGDQMILNEEVVKGEARKVIVNKDIRVAGGEAHRQNELLRTTLALLLSAPEGTDVSYIYAGETTIDGNSCDIVEAQTSGSAIKLYIDKSSSLLRMMSFQSPKPMIFRMKKGEEKSEPSGEEKVFVRELGAPETAEFQVKFADYRSVGGLQFPHKWTQTVAGSTDETVDISDYEINPPNIAEKFKELPRKVMIRTKKEQ